MKDRSNRIEVSFRLTIGVLAVAVLGGWGTTATAAAQDGSADVAEAHQVISRAIARYHNLNTYQDQMESRTVIVARDGNGNDVSQDTKAASFLRFARPNQIALGIDKQIEVYSNGRYQWTVFRPFGQYTKKPAPQVLDLSAALPDFVRGAVPIHPVALVLSQPQSDFLRIFPGVQRLTSLTRQAFNDKPGKLVTGVVTFSQPPLDRPLAFSAWFADADGLLREIRVDVTAAITSMAEAAGSTGLGQMKSVAKAEWIIRLSDIVVDSELPSGRFTFAPSADDEKVDVIGQRAPPFTGTDLAGKRLSLKELRDQVVVLDFWATWCGPCILAMPLMQKLADDFADQPVSIIGINSDHPQATKRVRQFLKSKNLTFRQYMDTDGSVSNAYQVMGIPHTVLIDRKGMVRHSHSGYSPRMNQELRSKIEQLLNER